MKREKQESYPPQRGKGGDGIIARTLMTACALVEQSVLMPTNLKGEADSPG